MGWKKKPLSLPTRQRRQRGKMRTVLSWEIHRPRVVGSETSKPSKKVMIALMEYWLDWLESAGAVILLWSTENDDVVTVHYWKIIENLKSKIICLFVWNVWCQLRGLSLCWLWLVLSAEEEQTEQRQQILQLSSLSWPAAHASPPEWLRSGRAM